MTKRLLAAGLHTRAKTDSRPMPIKLDVTRFEDISVPAEVRTDTNPSSTMPVFMLAAHELKTTFRFFEPWLAGG